MTEGKIYVKLTDKGILTYKRYVLKMCLLYKNTKFYQSMFLYYCQFLDRINKTFLGTFDEINNIFGSDLIGNIEGCEYITEEKEKALA